MALHRLSSVTVGVHNLKETAAYYADFGLAPSADGAFTTIDGGQQLRLVDAPYRRLIEARVGADDLDDVDRVATQLRSLSLPVEDFSTGGRRHHRRSWLRRIWRR